MLNFSNSLCVILHEIVFCLKQFVLAIFAIESNFAAILSAKALETSLRRMWGSGHNFIGSISDILSFQYCCLRGSGSSALNYAEFFR